MQGSVRGACGFSVAYGPLPSGPSETAQIRTHVHRNVGNNEALDGDLE